MEGTIFTLSPISIIFVSFLVELCVNLCRFLTVDIFQLAIFKFSLFCIKMFMTPLLLFQFYLFLEKFELAYFVQYGPIYFLMFYVKHKLQVSTVLGLFF